MNVTLRPGKPADAQACGTICYEAFKNISERHGFPPDIPNADVAAHFLGQLLSTPAVYCVVAESNGRVIGSNFLWESDAIAGIGPITIDPKAQDQSIGRRLMENVLERCRERKVAGERLVQAAFHNRSLSLYTKLGFDVREPLAVLQGKPLKLKIPGTHVRPVTERDMAACNELCARIHGHERAGEIAAAVHQGTATLVERPGRVSGYATVVGFFGHSVGETNEDLQALIGAAPEYAGPGFLLPTRNGELFRWCLGHGLRVMQPMTLMSHGLYNEPAGRFLPSILF